MPFGPCRTAESRHDDTGARWARQNQGITEERPCGTHVGLLTKPEIDNRETDVRVTFANIL